MNISATLDKAADVIVENGWTQGSTHDTDQASGILRGEVVSYKPRTSPFACRVCARGAISIASDRHPDFTETPYDQATVALVEGEDDDVLGDADQAALNTIREAERAFARHLAATGLLTEIGHIDPQLWGHNIVARWNDNDARSAEQVIAELRAAAQAEREAGR